MHVASPMVVTLCAVADVPRALARASLGEPSAAGLIVVADAVDVGALAAPGVTFATGREVAGEGFGMLLAGLEAGELAASLAPAALRRAGGPALLSVLGSAIGDAILVPEAADLGWAERRIATFEVAGLVEDLAARFTVQRLPERIADGDPPAAGGVDRPQTVSATLPDGTPMDDRLRSLFIAAVRGGKLDRAPFDVGGMRAFQRHLDGPADDARAGGVSRFLFDVWLGRPDLQDAFADLRDAAHRERFLDWVVAHGRHEIAMPDWLLPEDRLPDETAAAELAPAVDVAGWSDAEPAANGLVRAVTRALDEAGVAVRTLRSSPPPDGADAVAAAAPPFPVMLVCGHGAGARRTATAAAGPEVRDRPHTIGVWSEPPPPGDPPMTHLDELWVASSWLRDAITPGGPLDVREMPVAVARPHVVTTSRPQLGLPEGFLVLSYVDCDGSLERQNPLGLIAAFADAFAPGDGASLVVRLINGDRHPRDRLALKLAAAHHPDIHVLDQRLGAAEHTATLAACDSTRRCITRRASAGTSPRPSLSVARRWLRSGRATSRSCTPRPRDSCRSRSSRQATTVGSEMRTAAGRSPTSQPPPRSCARYAPTPGELTAARLPRPPACSPITIPRASVSACATGCARSRRASKPVPQTTRRSRWMRAPPRAESSARSPSSPSSRRPPPRWRAGCAR